MDREQRPAKIRAKVGEPVRKRVVWLPIAFLGILKPFPFLHGILPRKMQLVRSRDKKMIRDFVLSGGSRVYMDQNCRLNEPATYKPLVQVDSRYQFSESDIKSFYDNGFIGPLTLWTPEEMQRMRPEIEKVLERPSAVFPNAENKWRDRHIDCPEFWSLIQSPQIKERLAQLLGPDMMVWRSQVFMKTPGTAETTWHQASTYIAERKYKPALEPSDINSLFQLTTWIAIDDAFFENGCMHFLKGTHKKIWTVKMGGTEQMGEWNDTARLIGGKGTFAQVTNNMVLELPMKPELIAPMPLKAGQCVIFTERCIHGAPPNVSDQRRFGMVFRTVKTDVQVYRGDTAAEIAVLKENYQLDNWGCMLLRGEDKYHLNRMMEPPTPALAHAAVG